MVEWMFIGKQRANAAACNTFEPRVLAPFTFPEFSDNDDLHDPGFAEHAQTVRLGGASFSGASSRHYAITLAKRLLIVCLCIFF